MVLHACNLKPHKSCQLSNVTLEFWAALLFPVSLCSHLWFTSSWQLYWHISLFLIHLLPYLLSLFLTICGPHSSIPQPRLLPWKCLSFPKLNCWIFLCVASPGCTGFSPLQLSGINVRIILRQPPWFPIQLKFILVVFEACLRHASGSLIQFVSLCSSSCSSWLSSTWFPVSLQELCVFLEIFTRTIQLNKKWFYFMLHSHPFGSSIEDEFASRSICRHSKFEEYRSIFLEYECKYLQRNSVLGGTFFQLGSRAVVTWPLCPSKIWNTFHILKTEFSHGTSCKPFADPWLDCSTAPHALNREQFKATQEEPKRLSLSKK